MLIIKEIEEAVERVEQQESLEKKLFLSEPNATTPEVLEPWPKKKESWWDRMF